MLDMAADALHHYGNCTLGWCPVGVNAPEISNLCFSGSTECQHLATVGFVGVMLEGIRERGRKGFTPPVYGVQDIHTPQNEKPLPPPLLLLVRFISL